MKIFEINKDKAVEFKDLIGDIEKKELSGITMAIHQREERAILEGMYNCEYFRRYIKQRYYLKIGPITLKRDGYISLHTRTCQLIRKKDEKILAEWES